MKYRVFAVKDKALDSFSSPFTQATVEAGVRMFRDLVAFGSENNHYRRSPGDYSLWLIGEYDDSTGDMQTLAEKVVVSSALEVLAEVAKPQQTEE